MNIGDTVKCQRASIDEKCKAGEIGEIIQFVRFSAYHAREALVRFPDGITGYFWVHDLELAQRQSA